jgi:arylsulfatase A-like enzyme
VGPPGDVRGVLILGLFVFAACSRERTEEFRAIPSQQTLQATLPNEPFLVFDVAVRTSKEVSRGSVRFSVRLSEEGRDLTVHAEIVRARGGDDLPPRSVNLAAWRGRDVTLTFSAEPAYPELAGSWIEDVEAAWVAPRVENRALPPPPPRPSIVLVLVDTLRRDYLGFHGFEGPVSPNLDWLAKESTVFENAFTQAPWTKPSIASLFTSLHPDTHGLDNHEGLFGARESQLLTTGVLPSSAVTLAEALRGAGYRTAAFVSNPWLDERYGFHQGFETYELVEALPSILERARDFALGETPYFLYLHFMDVHGPYDAPETDFAAMKASASLEPRAVPVPGGGLPPYLEGISWFGAADLKDRDFGEIVSFRLTRSRTARARYAANVLDFDRSIAPFLNEIRNSDRNDDTLLVLTSDHGEELLEHGGWDHGFNLYDHQLRVPLLIRAPGARESGRRLSRIANLVDVMPTLLALAKVEAPDGLEGRDLMGPEDAASATFAAATKHREGVHSVRKGRYKLIRDGRTGTESLFDVEADSAEYRDVASVKKSEAERLSSLLARHIERSRGARLHPEMADIPEEIRKQLEALGYLTETRPEQNR